MCEALFLKCRSVISRNDAVMVRLFCGRYCASRKVTLWEKDPGRIDGGTVRILRSGVIWHRSVFISSRCLIQEKAETGKKLTEPGIVNSHLQLLH